MVHKLVVRKLYCWCNHSLAESGGHCTRGELPSASSAAGAQASERPAADSPSPAQLLQLPSLAAHSWLPIISALLTLTAQPVRRTLGHHRTHQRSPLLCLALKPSLLWIHPPPKLCSLYAYGVLDEGFRWDLSVEEAIELGLRSIYHATFRDAASGGTVSGARLGCLSWPCRAVLQAPAAGRFVPCGLPRVWSQGWHLQALQTPCNSFKPAPVTATSSSKTRRCHLTPHNTLQCTT